MDMAQTRRIMKTMKKTYQLQTTLEGLSSILDIYPDSDLSAELERIYALTKQTHIPNRHYAAADNLTVVTHKLLRGSLKAGAGAREDMRALSSDWQSVGSCILDAYHKKSKDIKKSTRKGDADCWSY